MTVSLFLGGARSGKSKAAEKYAALFEYPKIYIATAQARDDEMQTRIAHHQQLRNGANWITIEEPIDIAKAIEEAPTNSVILVDCLTLWLNNLMEAQLDLSYEFNQLKDVLKKCSSDIIFVSNETGMGIVPINKLARDFRDEAGRLNQVIAEASDNVYFMVAGIPLALKKNGKILAYQ